MFMTWGPIHERFFYRNSNSTENWFQCNSILGYHIATESWQCHVQNYIAITPMQLGWEHHGISVEFELRRKNRITTRLCTHEQTPYLTLTDELWCEYLEKGYRVIKRLDCSLIRNSNLSIVHVLHAAVCRIHQCWTSLCLPSHGTTQLYMNCSNITYILLFICFITKSSLTYSFLTNTCFNNHM